MSKNLSEKHAKKKFDEKFKSKKRIKFYDNTRLDVDVIFNPVKLENATKELLYLIQEMVEGGYVIDDPKVMNDVMSTIMIKHFTSIETDAEGYYRLLELCLTLKKEQYYDSIVSALPITEKEKLYNLFEKGIMHVVDSVKKAKEDAIKDEKND